ncbi:Mlp family lipoprotein [Borrelia venezuelensis]|uniref:Mlp family lipoprotein n=1 Tax=Borrelia venezuelensis TaxID=1653839 RepID=UPI001FF1607D|nr:Mlp family lipoprotein [Borrelia venezuelensis]UPA12547.1 Mlp family lipoprotein [Borrelia venezuelensis]
MKKVSFILFTLLALLLINSCDWFDSNKDVKSRGRSKRETTEEQKEEVQKTPEELLKTKLNDTEKANLNFLKESLGSEADFNKFLSHDESKIKEVLGHIQSELEKCNGDDANEQKNTFKQVLQGSFKGNSDDLDKFKEQAASTCQAGASG